MKLLLIDKDGTLIQPASGTKFVNKPWDQEALPGAREAIARFASQGWHPIIISNQGGIAAGYKSVEETIAEMRFCMELFPEIHEAFFCPDFEGSQCWRVWNQCSEQQRILYGSESFDVWELGLQGQFRKPNPGMLQLAIHLHGADAVMMVGDRDEDSRAALTANVPFVWADEWRRH